MLSVSDHKQYGSCPRVTNKRMSKHQDFKHTACQQKCPVKAGRRLHDIPDNGDVIFDLRDELFLFKVAVGHVNDTLTH